MTRLVLPCLILLLALSFACTDDDDADPATTAASAPAGSLSTLTPVPEGTQAPAQTPTPAVTATPDGDAGAQVTPPSGFSSLTYGAATEFPRNTMLLVITGCSSCDGPADALYRVYRNEGEVNVDELVTAAIDPGATHITGLAVRPGLSEIVVAVCTQGICAGDPQDEQSFYKSTDGGATWPLLARESFETFRRAVAIDTQGLILIGEDDGRYLDGGEFPRPPGVEGSLFTALSVINGNVLWNDRTRMVRSDGREVLEIAEAGNIWATLEEDGSPDISVWSLPGEPGRIGLVLSTEGPNGRYGFSTDQALRPLAWLTEGSLLAGGTTPDIGIGATVMVVDFANGVVHPIERVFEEPPFGSRPGGIAVHERNEVLGLAFGTFLRVEVGAGSCLNVRETPSVVSPVQVCLQAGAIVFDRDDTAMTDGIAWRLVTLFDGRVGWADGQYLLDD